MRWTVMFCSRCSVCFVRIACFFSSWFGEATVSNYEWKMSNCGTIGEGFTCAMGITRVLSMTCVWE